MSIHLYRERAKALIPGYYVFTGSTNPKMAPVYTGNKKGKDASVWGVNTTVDLRPTTSGQWAWVLNEKAKLFQLLTSDQAQQIVNKSRFLGSGEQGRTLRDLFVMATRWHKSSVPAVLKSLDSMKVPEQYRRLPSGMLYRGITIPDDDAEALHLGQTIELSTKTPFSSWSTSFKTARDFVMHTEDTWVVIQRKDIRPQDVLLDIAAISLACTGSRDAALDFGDEGELVIRNNPAYNRIKPANVARLRYV